MRLLVIIFIFPSFEILVSFFQDDTKCKVKSGRHKALLHNGAMSAIQHSPELKEYYIRKTAEGKHQMLVINNVCNKLIHRVFACVNEKRKYKDS